MKNNVCIFGSKYEETELDYYGILKEIVELSYLKCSKHGSFVSVSLIWP